MGKFIIKSTNTGLKFDLIASSGEVIASSRIYKLEECALNGIRSVIRSAAAAAIEDQSVENFRAKICPKFEIYNDKNSEFRFRLKACNGRIIATSKGYKTLKSCLNGIESVKKNASDRVIEKADT